jgi:hypothetical protein
VNGSHAASRYARPDGSVQYTSLFSTIQGTIARGEIPWLRSAEASELAE